MSREEAMASKPNYDILFVRHGVSCANAYEKRRKSDVFYKDPELTAYGIQFSRCNRCALEDIVERLWPAKHFRVCSSAMLRAQETAYYMFLQDTTINLRILPHIGEDNPGNPDRVDDIPFPKDEQRKFLSEDIRKRIDYDVRDSEEHLHHDPSDTKHRTLRSNWPAFLEWIVLQQQKGQIKEFFDGEGTRRAIIFTHSGFLKRFFNQKMNNNGILRVTFSMNGTQATNVKVEILHNPAPNDRKANELNRCTRIPGPVNGGRRVHTRKKRKTRKQRK